MPMNPYAIKKQAQEVAVWLTGLTAQQRDEELRELLASSPILHSQVKAELKILLLDGRKK